MRAQSKRRRGIFVPMTNSGRDRSCGLVQRTGAADSATPHLRPSGGQAPRLAKSSTALHSPLPTPLDSGLRRNDEISRGSLSRIGVRDMLS